MPEPSVAEPAETPRIGRPLKFPSLAELEKQIEAFFVDCDTDGDSRIFEHGDEHILKIPTIKKGKRVVEKQIVCALCRQPFFQTGCKLVSGKLKIKRPYTVTGLAVWLDTSRQTLLEYQGEVPGRERDPAFADTIRKAKQRIENYGEEKLYDKEHPTKGVIFSLSNNHEGWAEKIEAKVRDDRDPVKALTDRLFARLPAAADTAADVPAPTVAATEATPAGGGVDPVPGVLPGDGQGNSIPVPDEDRTGVLVEPAGGTQERVHQDQPASGKDGSDHAPDQNASGVPAALEKPEAHAGNSVPERGASQDGRGQTEAVAGQGPSAA